METLGEFFKNRILFHIHRCDSKEGNPVKRFFYFVGHMDNPQRLNIKNSIDLVENLTPLLTYILSYRKKI